MKAYRHTFLIWTLGGSPSYPVWLQSCYENAGEYLSMPGNEPRFPARPVRSLATYCLKYLT